MNSCQLRAKKGSTSAVEVSGAKLWAEVLPRPDLGGPKKVIPACEGKEV